ncbi:murein biosynthesis integral membrane protein MurJ [Microbacterium candidum]|uniref:Murein biosynthesis integral membrane protein MurJ n=1 Tax=Microbacterium candidum TaxID=3041922 RepID=A0ABT7MU93_9MICO|nr:murein biosynthesis integral membrane protein MurJ [Microbacterium sp. ASV49]MDL9978016.1 murein biosynthesis integral membrane protein MurJ [Microbacterium sp. ASV49]
MSSIGRASALIGAGTLASRATGLLRSVVLVTALGAAASADSFNVANSLPNAIYMIVSTGILTAVIVPQIVKASRAEDGGRAFISKLFTLGTVILLVVAVVATAFAPLLVRLYAAKFTPAQIDLSTAFAYWCLPQIFFYGMYAMVGETLNARRIFGPYTWAPIVNNIVSIAGFGLFIVLFGSGQKAPTAWTPEMIALIGGSATLGIILQTVVLFLFWKRTGIRIGPDFRWRGMGLGHIGRLAGWTFLMVLVTQLAAIVQSQVQSTASADDQAGQTIALNAGLIFILPYSIIALSIGTPYFTRLSEHVAQDRFDDVPKDVSSSVRSISLLIVLSTAALVASAVPVSRLFTTSQSQAVDAAIVLLAYLVGLIPIGILFTVQRTFYAYNDTRTPFWFTAVQAAVAAALAAASLQLAPEFRTAGVALGQSISILVQVVIATILLRRTVGNLRVRVWMLSLGRYLVAAIPAGALGWLTFLLLGGVDGWTTSSQLLGAVGTVIIGAVVAVVYIAILAALRAPELAPVMSLVRRRIRR